MITGKPDPSLDLPRLEREIQAFRQEVNARDRWFTREKYVDRGKMDPFYILLFTHQVEDRGDDLKEEPLFATRKAALTVKHMTRLPGDGDRSYWKAIKKEELLARLDRFMKMYREDFLQPPGYYGDLFNTKQKHPCFKNKRFLYQIRSPKKNVIGVGSQKFANLGNFGAIRGKVCDENGKPLHGETVELISKTKTLCRISGDDGLFWFSRVPIGIYKLRVRGKNCIFQVSKEKFGKARGKLFTSEGKILPGGNIEFYAPDDELFETVSDSHGKYGLDYLLTGNYRVKMDGTQVAKI